MEKFNSPRNTTRWENEARCVISARRTSLILENLEEKENQHEKAPLAISYSEESPLPYCATYAWRLASMRQYDRRNEENEKKMTRATFEWQKSVLYGLAVPEQYRAIELRYNNFSCCQSKDRKGMEIFFIGHIHAQSIGDALSEGNQHWKDVLSLLTNGMEYYQFSPIQDAEEIFRLAFEQKFEHAKELRRECKEIDFSNNKREKMGFIPDTEEREESSPLLLPLLLNHEVHNIQNLTMFLVQNEAPVSLRILLAPSMLNEIERGKIENAIDAFDRGDQVKMSSRLRPMNEQKREECKKRMAQMAEESAFLNRVICLSSEPITPTAVNMVAENLFGQMGSRMDAVSLSPESVEELTYSSYPFPQETDRLPFFTSVSESARLFRIPIPVESCPGVKNVKLETLYIPSGLDQEGTLLGCKNTIYGKQLVRISEKSKSRHIYILGQTGTGKTTLISSMILNQIESGEGIGLIDPHGDLFYHILSILPEYRKQDLVLFDPSNLESGVYLNPLEFNPNHPQEKSFLVDSMMDVMDKLYDLRSTGGPMFEMYMRNAMLLVMEDRSGTILDIIRVLTDYEFRKNQLRKCRDSMLRRFWENEAEKADRDLSLANMAPYITSKLNAFIYNHFIRPIVSKPRSTINFPRIMNEGKIFLVNLAKGCLGSRNADMLGMFLINRLFLAALSRYSIPAEQRRKFTLYIDEFQNFTTDNVAHIFAEARKFNLSLICANQNLFQLKKEICNSALGTVGNLLCFRPGVSDVDIIGKYFEPEFDEKDLLNLPNFHVISRMLVNDVPCKPFLFQTLPIEKK